MSTKERILPGNYYHLYNHSNGNLNLFRSDENYRYFLEKYLKYTEPYIETLAYCLMPNHFHFFIRVKEDSKSSELFKGSEPLEKISPVLVTNSIKNWLICYTQSYHKYYGTRGNLFYQKIRRKLILDENYMVNLIVYLHLNPVIHGFTNDLHDWKYSSLNDFLDDSDSFLKKHHVFDLFGGKNNFLFCHNQKMPDNLLGMIDLDFIE